MQKNQDRDVGTLSKHFLKLKDENIEVENFRLI